MNRGYRYSDALRLLGGTDPTIKAVDALLSVGTLGLWDLIDFKSELVKVGADLLSRWREWRTSDDWPSRTQRIEAAHAILVITAFFEAIDELNLPFTTANRKTLKENLQPQSAHRKRALRRLLQRAMEDISTLSCPSPQHPYENIKNEISEFYQQLSRRVLEFIRVLNLWEGLKAHQIEEVTSQVKHVLPGQAVSRYEDLYRRLASDVPEFAMWANMVDHQATRSGLAGLETILDRIAGRHHQSEQLATLRRVHRKALDRSIAETGGVPMGMRMPTLGEAYICQRFRVGEIRSGDIPSLESWWEDKEVRDDLPGFLAGFLTHPDASRVPLLVLGQPGAGKSVLTKVLGARLSETFLPVRVPLRDVCAKDEIQDQVEAAIYQTAGEHTSWPELVRAAKSALPVVILDGFDELLQATRMRQSDYLRKVERFQEREREAGRPVAIIVTSRTAVAHCARPPKGTVVARLEPFDQEQIERWVAVWNNANSDYFRMNGLRPFPPDSALAKKDLGGQPLLLLMLALYDASENGPTNLGSALGHAELFERLIASFVTRELEKDGSECSAEMIEREIQRLSYAAFSMFNRQRQWATAEEVNADLGALGIQAPTDGGFATPLSMGEQTFGRFFFVYKNQATRDADILVTYEFLHGTFGEYLIARLVASLLRKMAATPRDFLLDDTNDGRLRSLLSWATLSAHPYLITFLQELACVHNEAPQWNTLILGLFRSLDERPDMSSQNYIPRIAGAARRSAYYSANLALLAVTTADRVAVSELMPGHEIPTTAWERYFYLWKSQCAKDEWEAHMRVIASAPVKSDVVLRLNRSTESPGADPGKSREGASMSPLAMITATPTGLSPLASHDQEEHDPST